MEQIREIGSINIACVFTDIPLRVLIAKQKSMLEESYRDGHNSSSRMHHPLIDLKLFTLQPKTCLKALTHSNIILVFTATVRLFA